MSVGVVLQIASGTQKQYRVPAGYESPSITVLNPNDGAVYVARNRDADSTSTAGWDYKVPSQSYAALPGPYVTAGLLYQDLSGSNATGEIIVYDINTSIVIPGFQAIGVAGLSQGTSVDISMGAQPQNPPANTARLWIDGQGNLNILQPDGTNALLVDTLNIQGQAIAGDIYNTIGDTRIGIRYGRSAQAYDSGGTLNNLISGASNVTSIFAMDNNYVQMTNQAMSPFATFDIHNTSLYGANASSGWLYLNQYPCFGWDGSYLHAYNNLLVDNGSFYLNSGQNIFMDSSRSYYITNDTGQGRSYFGTVGMNVLSWGNFCFNGNPGINWSWNGGQIIATHPVISGGGIFLVANGGIGFNWTGSIQATHTMDAPAYLARTAGYAFYMAGAQNSLYWDNSTLTQWASVANTFRITQWGASYFDMIPTGSHDVQGNSAWFSNAGIFANFFQPNSNSAGYFVGPQRGGASANEVSAIAHLYVPGTVWCTNVSYLSTIRAKTIDSVLDPKDALAMVLDPRVDAYKFQYNSPEEGDASASPDNYGFTAEDMLQVVPEAVMMDHTDPNNPLPGGLVMVELIPVLWAAVRQLYAMVEGDQLATPTDPN